MDKTACSDWEKLPKSRSQKQRTSATYDWTMMFATSNKVTDKFQVVDSSNT